MKDYTMFYSFYDHNVLTNDQWFKIDYVPDIAIYITA